MKKIILVLFPLFLLYLSGCDIYLTPGNNGSAQITISEYVVVFDGNGGTLVSGKEIQIVNKSEDIVEPVYEKSGYVFVGWDIQISSVKESRTIKAQWVESSSFDDTSLYINGFEEKDKILKKNVNNDVDVYSLINEVHVSSNSTWKLFSDIYGTQEIVTKIVNLQIGDNIYYLVVTSSNDDVVSYTLKIRRLPLYNVKFTIDSVYTLYEEMIQEGSLIDPISAPSKVGYDFVGWNYDFSKPIVNDLIIDAVWKIHESTIILEVNDGDELSVSQYQAKYGEYITLPVPTHTGYTFRGWFTEPDGKGVQITGSDGASNAPWMYTDVTKLYAFFEKELSSDEEEQTPVVPTADSKSITEAKALADKENVVVDGQVTNVTPGTGIIITDGTQSIFVYCGKNLDISHLQVGDKVTVSGAMGTYNKGRQIASPVITLIERGKYEVEIPSLSLDEINALDPEDPSVYGRAYKTTLTIKVSGSYVNAAEGNSLYLSNEDKEALAELDGKQIEIVVFIYNYNSKARKFNLLANVEFEDETSLAHTEGAISIADAKTLADKEAVIVDGQVTNVTLGTGIIITDGVQSIFIYCGKNVDVSYLQIGDKVSVSGVMGTYNKGRQIASPVITLKASGKYEAEIPTLSLDEINALDPDDASIYGKAYKTTLTVKVSGSYVNAAEGNSLYLSNDDKEALMALDGKQIEIVVFIYNYNSKAAKFNLLANGDTAVVK